MSSNRKKEKAKTISSLPTSFLVKLKKVLVENGPLLIILVAALALRLVLFTGIVRNDDLDYLHYAQDINLGQASILDGLSEPFTEIGWRFGFYLPVVVLYKLFGPSPWTTIAFPLISSLLGILFVYLIGVTLFGKKIGLLASFLWAIFPLDVHLATDLIPDGPMTSFSIGAVYFYLRATQSKKINRLALAISGLLLLWAIFIKPFAMVTLFFLFFWWMITWLPKSPRVTPVIKWVRDLPRIYYWVGGSLIVIFIGIYLFLQRLPFHISFLLSSQDLFELFFGIRPNRFRPLDTSYPMVTPLVPLFAMAIMFSLLKSKTGSKFMLTWAAFSFAYLEWGPSRISIEYAPTVPLAEARNLMLVFVPLLIMASFLLINTLMQKNVSWIIAGCALLTVVMAMIAKTFAFSGPAEYLFSIGLLISVIGAFFLPGVSRLKNSVFVQSMGLVFIVGLSTALLNPSLPDHFTEPRFVTQANLQADLKPIVEYLSEHNEFPIIAFTDDTGENLNYVSNLRFGFKQHTPFTPGVYRIVEDDNPIQRQDSFYAVFYSDYRGGVPSDWWKIMELKEGLTFPVFLYRHLSVADARVYLEQSLATVKKEPVPANYYELFGAAKNAHDLPSAVLSWIQLKEDPNYLISLGQLEEVAILAAEENPNYLETNLLKNSSFINGETHWQIGPGVQVKEVTEGLSLNFTEKLQEFQGLSQTVELEANTLYYFTIRLKSNISTSVLEFAGEDIETSLENKDIYGEFTDLSGIFVTPAWIEDTRTVDILIASGRQAGSITVNSVGLYKLVTVR